MEEMVNKLNGFLADLNVFYRKLQNYHWNVKGKNFFVLHEKLEEYYDKINEEIDEIAEHILTLDKQPLGTMKDYLEKSCIEEAQNAKIEGEIVLDKVLKDFETLLQKMCIRDRCFTIYGRNEYDFVNYHLCNILPNYDDTNICSV